jgi:hypothetical protein
VTHAAEKRHALEAVRAEWTSEKMAVTDRLEALQEEVRRKDVALVNAVSDAMCEGDQKV